MEAYRNKVLGKEIEIPKVLEKLYQFDEEYGAEMYSECFSIGAQEEDTFEYYFDFDEEQVIEYNKQIKPFATVDGTGGFAAFWLIDNNREIANAPIIIYGSEGQIKITAKNIFDFMRLLTFDCELMDGASYMFKEDYEASEYKQEFREFIKKEFDLDPVCDLNSNQKNGNSEDSIKITQEAEKLFKEKFIEWHKPFGEISYED